MSTKRLSRTVLEGGRYTRNKYDRYLSIKEERAAARDYITGCIKDNELVEEEPLPTRRKVYKGFTDKLAPVRRWLDKRVGKVGDKHSG